MIFTKLFCGSVEELEASTLLCCSVEKDYCYSVAQQNVANKLPLIFIGSTWQKVLRRIEEEILTYTLDIIRPYFLLSRYRCSPWSPLNADLDLIGSLRNARSVESRSYPLNLLGLWKDCWNAWRLWMSKVIIAPCASSNVLEQVVAISTYCKRSLLVSTPLLPWFTLRKCLLSFLNFNLALTPEIRLLGEYIIHQKVFILMSLTSNET